MIMKSIDKSKLENKIVFAIWTDHADFLLDINDLEEDKLLELRAFDKNSEYRVYRSTVDSDFYARFAEDSAKSVSDYFDTEHFLDIDSTANKNNTRKTIGGGTFHLPLAYADATKIVIRNYVKYDDDGIASVCDWRIVQLKEDK